MNKYYEEDLKLKQKLAQTQKMYDEIMKDPMFTFLDKVNYSKKENKLVLQTYPHKSLTKKGYIVRKDTLTEKQINKIVKELNVKPIVNKMYSAESDPFQVYKEDDNYYYLPRYYGLNTFGNPDFVDLESKKIEFMFKGKIRDNQAPVVEEAMKQFGGKIEIGDNLNLIIKDIGGGGLLQLPCGFGKTLTAIYLAFLLGVKTLVIVHKTFLQNQWFERIKQFTNAKIGIIRQKKVDVENKDIVIGMLQSISMIDYDPKIFEDFGLIVVDEAHHISSRVFSRALFKVGGKYTLGLSATPQRADGLTKVLNWHLGDIMYKIERKGDINVYIKMFNYKSTNVKLFSEKKQYFQGKVVPGIQKMVTNLTILNERNQFIINIMNSIMHKYERKILVLSARLEHLDILKKGIDLIIKQKVESGEIEPREITTAKYIGGMKDYQLEDSSEADIIFATYAMAKEGLDIDKLNTLILATPEKDVIQSIGRVMRKQIAEGDICPIVIDIADELSLFKKWGSKREEYYKSMKYNVNTYQALNDKCMSVKDYLAMNNIVVENDDDMLREYYCMTHSQYEYDIAIHNNRLDKTKYIYDSNLDNIFDVDTAICYI